MANVPTAPINSLPIVEVTGPFAALEAIPIVTGNTPMPPAQPVLAQNVVVVASGSMPMAPVQPIPAIVMAPGTPTNPSQAIPVIIVG